MSSRAMSSGGGAPSRATAPRFPVFLTFFVMPFLFALGLPPVCAQESHEIRRSVSVLPVQRLTLGGQNGWEEVALFENTRLIEGWQGGYDLALEERRAVADDTSDLLLGFDGRVEDAAGRYRVASDGGTITEAIRRYGSGAQAFTGRDGILLEAGPEALFRGERIVDEVSIEFWFYPNRTTDGAQILHWSGVIAGEGGTVIQNLAVELIDGHLRWVFDDLVLVPGGGYDTVVLEGRRDIVPRRWQHHRLSYDPTTARLSYDIDGAPVDVRYLTNTGREDGDPRALYLGRAANGGLAIGDHVIGVIDELRVHLGTVPPFEQSAYSGNPGVITTAPIDLGSASTRLRAIILRTVEPGSTEIRGFYRLGDRPVSRDPRYVLGGPWVPIPAGGVIPDAEYGRFLQLRIDLLADAPREHTPRVQAIDIEYETSPPPPPPAVIRGESVSGGVNLRWNAVRTGNIVGYRVFFGEEPGRYIGVTGVLSPLDVGDRTEVEIRGLKPDVPYVFAVQSYDHQGQTGPISREIEVRGGGLE